MIMLIAGYNYFSSSDLFKIRGKRFQWVIMIGAFGSFKRLVKEKRVSLKLLYQSKY